MDAKLEQEEVLPVGVDAHPIEKFAIIPLNHLWGGIVNNNFPVYEEIAKKLE